MEKKKTIKIIVTIILTIIEILIWIWLSHNNITEPMNEIFQFLTYTAPVGILYFVNYYILSEILIYFGMGILIFLGYYKYISKRYNKIASKCIAWLVNTDLHWGVIDKAEQCQNANTCEGILAIMKTDLENRYSNVYQEAISEVFDNITDRGLTSKSLKYETVVCTTMILFVYAVGKKKNKDFYPHLNNKLNKIAFNLWNVRGDFGWGVFVETSKTNNCSVCNTFRALIVLKEYNVCDEDEYFDFVIKIYENSNESLFGFVKGDYPRLVPTAMSVILYYNLDKSLQKKLDKVYNVNKAVNYVFQQFCLKGMEIEEEIFHGLEVKSGGVKKAPWTHVTIAYAIEALAAAYRNKGISNIKINMLIVRIEEIYKKRIMYISENKHQCYYMPKDMQMRNDGIYTFPTAYFVIGVNMINLLVEGNHF